MYTSAAVITGSALLPLACGSPGVAAPTIPAGIQLYTLRDVLPDDLENVLRQIAEIGYAEVETHTYYGRSPADLKSMLDDAGLTAPAAHVGFAALRDDLEGVIEGASTMGHRYVILPHPGAMPHATLSDYRAAGEFLTTVGAQMSAAGIRFGYHNHGFEFTPIDGQIPFYVLMDYANPDDVLIELDLYWTVDGGIDPIEVIERYPGRIHAYHVKDRTADGAMVDVGAGAIDFAAIFAHNAHAGVRHLFVEHDNPPDSLESARASYAALSELTG